MARGLSRTAAAVAVVVLAGVGVFLFDGSWSSGSPVVAPQGGVGTATDDQPARSDGDGIRFASCAKAIVDADDRRVEVELTDDGGMQFHTYENVSGTTTFTVSKAGRSPDRWPALLGERRSAEHASPVAVRGDRRVGASIRRRPHECSRTP